MRPAVAVLFLFLVISACAAAADRPPLGLEQIRLLKSAGLADEEIGGLIIKRGISFAIDVESTLALQEMGCAKWFILKIEKIGVKKPDPPADLPKEPEKLPETDPDPDSKPKPPDLEHEPKPPGIGPIIKPPEPDPKIKPPEPDPKIKQPDPKPKPPEGEPRQHVPFGPGATDKEHNDWQSFYNRVMLGSTLKVKMYPSKHVTLICTEAAAKKFLPVAAKVEETIEKTFPGRIKTGTDKRSAFIALADGRKEYQAFIASLFQEKQAGGVDTGGANTLLMALNGSGWLTPTFCVSDLESYKTDAARASSVAYDMGYIYLRQVTDTEGSDFLVTGFGNYCEAIIDKNPQHVIFSYDEHKLNEIQTGWRPFLIKRIQAKQASDATAIFGMRTSGMEGKDYVEAWSLTSYLAARPVEFEKLLTSLAGGKKIEEAIPEIYKLDAKTLTQKWQQWALTQQ
jgi:hypothetical protein